MNEPLDVLVLIAVFGNQLEESKEDEERVSMLRNTLDRILIRLGEVPLQ